MANFTASVAFSADDCGHDAGSINLTAAGMGYGISGGTAINAGLRWRGVTIPNGATITAAKLTITARITLSGAGTHIKIDGETADAPAAFSTLADYNARTRTTANVTWDPSSQTANTAYDTPDIKTIIQEIVNQAQYASGDAIVLFLNDNGSTPSPNFRNSYQQDGGTAVVLNVDYTIASNTNRNIIFECVSSSLNSNKASNVVFNVKAPSAITRNIIFQTKTTAHTSRNIIFRAGVPPTTSSKSSNILFYVNNTRYTGIISIDSDDAWGESQPLTNFNAYWNYGAFGVTTPVSKVQLTTMRWNNIVTPPGAKVTSAKITFVADQNQSGVTVNARIDGEAADNPITFSNNIDYNARPRTTAFYDWSNVGAWLIGVSYDTPDISSIIQEILDRPGWVSGNSLALTIQDNGSSENAYRSFESYDSNSALAPVLTITFDSSVHKTQNVIFHAKDVKNSSRNIVFRAKISSNTNRNIIYTVLSAGLSSTQRNVVFITKTTSANIRNVIFSIKNVGNTFRNVIYRIKTLSSTSRNIIYRINTLSSSSRNIVFRVQTLSNARRNVIFYSQYYTRKITNVVWFVGGTVANATRNIVFRIKTISSASRNVIFNIISAGLSATRRNIIYRVKTLSSNSRNIVFIIKNSSSARRNIVYKVVGKPSTSRNILYLVKTKASILRNVVWLVGTKKYKTTNIIYRIKSISSGIRNVVYRIKSNATVSRNVIWLSGLIKYRSTNITFKTKGFSNNSRNTIYCIYTLSSKKIHIIWLPSVVKTVNVLFVGVYVGSTRGSFSPIIRGGMITPAITRMNNNANILPFNKIFPKIEKK